MENGTAVKNGAAQFASRRGFTSWKEKPSRTEDYLELLAHFEAELRQTGGPIVVVRYKTGTELPLEQKAKLLMVRLLLEEFGTVARANAAIGAYRLSHS